MQAKEGLKRPDQKRARPVWRLVQSFRSYSSPARLHTQTKGIRFDPICTIRHRPNPRSHCTRLFMQVAVLDALLKAIDTAFCTRQSTTNRDKPFLTEQSLVQCSDEKSCQVLGI